MRFTFSTLLRLALEPVECEQDLPAAFNTFSFSYNLQAAPAGLLAAFLGLLVALARANGNQVQGLVQSAAAAHTASEDMVWLKKVVASWF